MVIDPPPTGQPAHAVYFSLNEQRDYDWVRVGSRFTQQGGQNLEGVSDFESRLGSPLGHFVRNPTPGIWDITGASLMYYVVEGGTIVNPSLGECNDSVVSGF